MLAASETIRKIFDLVRKKIVQVQDKYKTSIEQYPDISDTLKKKAAILAAI